MCWSWEISLTFASIQWIIIVYLCYRNQFLDRYLAIAQSVIAAQETFQFLLWAFAIDDETTETSCSSFNTFCSYSLLFIVESVIPVYSVLAICISRKTDQGTWRYYTCWICFFCALLWYILYIIAAIYYDFYRDDVHCTYKGPHGHQVWGFMDIEGFHTVIKLINNMMWGFVIILFIICIYPSWPVLPVAIYAAISFLILSAVYQSGENGSMWCWINFIEALWYLFTYHIAKYIVHNNIEDKKGCCVKYLFSGTKAWIVLTENKTKDTVELSTV